MDTLIVIDTETTFLRALQDKLDDLGMLQTLSIASIQPWASSVREVLSHVAEEIGQLRRRDEKIEAVFVDIVILEGRDPEDRSGIEVAKLVRTLLPGIPTIAITHYEKSYRLISEISFESCFDGLLLKTHMLGKDFSRRDMLHCFEKAKAKALTTACLQSDLSSSALGLVAAKAANQTSQITPSQDPRTRHQVHKIGEACLYSLVADLFPKAQGTITALRPGFSGSYVFKLSVKTVESDISPSETSFWVVKVSALAAELQNELDRCKRLPTRVPAGLYPALKKDALTIAGGWAALAFEMKSDTIVLSEYLTRLPSADEVGPLVLTSLKDFLKQHYGQPIPRHHLVWQELYELGGGTKAAALDFIEEALSMDHPTVKPSRSHLKRVRDFIVSNGETEPAVFSKEADVYTTYIHGDLNSRNILVALDRSSLSFIDFANSAQDHWVRDIAKLEADLLFLVMDSGGWRMSDWARVSSWMPILDLYGLDRLLQASQPDIGDESVRHIWQVISYLRQCLDQLSPTRCNEQEYCLALIYYGIHHLSYPDVTLQKKTFGVRWLSHLFQQMETK